MTYKKNTYEEHAVKELAKQIAEEVDKEILADIVKEFEMSNKPSIRYPHCDSRVLHAPIDNCKYCNESGLQDGREAWGINFTGRHDPGKTICPGEKARGMQSINSWGGNVAHTPEVDKTQEEYYDNLLLMAKELKENWEALEKAKAELTQDERHEIAELGKRLVDLD